MGCEKNGFVCKFVFHVYFAFVRHNSMMIIYAQITPHLQTCGRTRKIYTKNLQQQLSGLEKYNLHVFALFRGRFYSKANVSIAWGPLPAKTTASKIQVAALRTSFYQSYANETVCIIWEINGSGSEKNEKRKKKWESNTQVHFAGDLFTLAQKIYSSCEKRRLNAEQQFLVEYWCVI